MDGYSDKHAFPCRMVGFCCGLIFLLPAWIPFEKCFALVSREESSDYQATSDVRKPASGIIASHPEAARAWQNFTKRNNYRVARASDFRLSEDLYRAYGDGDFNGDRIYNDFAIIVVDDQRPDTSRFGLVIFNARKDSKGYDGPFWVYRGVNLSRTSLNLISHGPLIVTEYHDKEEAAVCIVRWNSARKRYRCERTG